MLAVRGLCKTFPVREGWKTKRLQANRDVSFDLDRGEVLALVGESGSGKSTTARLIARLEPPTSGQILFEDRDILTS